MSGNKPEAAQLVLVNDGEPKGGGLFAQFHPFHFEEVDVWGEGAQEVEDVVAAVVADDALALDGRAEANLFVLVVDHRVRQDLQLRASFLKKIHYCDFRETCF